MNELEKAARVAEVELIFRVWPDAHIGDPDKQRTVAVPCKECHVSEIGFLDLCADHVQAPFIAWRRYTPLKPKRPPLEIPGIVVVVGILSGLAIISGLVRLVIFWLWR